MDNVLKATRYSMRHIYACMCVNGLVRIIIILLFFYLICFIPYRLIYSQIFSDQIWFESD
jgi:hypothetical protein